MSDFIPVRNDVFLRALRRQPTEYTPIWLMRQAGRYLPEYRKTRSEAGSFMDLCKNPDAACEVTMQPLKRYPLDAAILFSDILTIPDAMGLGLYFSEGEGPQFERPIRTEIDVYQLRNDPVQERLEYVFDAVRTIRKALDGSVPLIGFSGSPWTLACYMIEGGASKDFRLIKSMMYHRPDLLHHILSVTTEAVTQYLNAQIYAGAQAVMVFDSWGGLLADNAFEVFSLSYTRKIIQSLKTVINRGSFTENIPSIIFTKGGGLWLEKMANSGADALGVDWTVNLQVARQLVGDRCAIQGNLDPCVLFAEPQQIKDQVIGLLESYSRSGKSVGHVFNLGHGISQYTPPDSVAVLVETVHSYSQQLHLK